MVLLQSAAGHQVAKKVQVRGASVKKCPRCGSRDVASYLYGMPVWSEVLEDEIKCGKITVIQMK